MPYIPFNINDNVKVRLTKRGESIYAAWRMGSPAPKACSEGWSTFQLWQLMEIFGPHLSIGQSFDSMPLATQILVESDAAQKAADAELDACCEWLEMMRYHPGAAEPLRAARRPKSLKQKAIERINSLASEFGLLSEAAIVREALLSIPDDITP